MTLELRPLGVSCNITCAYCYQNPIREAGNTVRHYSLERMLQAVEKANQSFTVFGGEALLIPHEDLEVLFSFGYEKFKKNGIQTNGTLMDDRHFEMFRRYQVHVGFSIDGPGGLNDARWAGSLERTRELTEKSLENLLRCLREGQKCGLIVTLHQLNAGTDELLHELMDWLRSLHQQGLSSMRIHVLEVDGEVAARSLALSEDRNLEVYLQFQRFSQEVPALYIDVFRDMERLMSGDDSNVTCVWKGCDPYSTSAVQGVDGDGKMSNCGRTAKEGIDFVKAQPGFERSIQLYHIPQEFGGCSGCRFFLLCRGNCPGTAMQGDFRQRSEHCGLWMKLFERFEQEFLDKGELPFSLSPDRFELEQAFLTQWALGKNPSIPLMRSKLPVKKHQVSVREQA